MNQYSLDLKAAILAHAQAESPRECCGVIIKVAGAYQYVPCQNMSTSPYEQFVLSPADFSRAEALGDIMGIVHSHPFANPDPSPADLAACELSGLPWVIVNPQTKEFRHFKPTGLRTALVGRPFTYGVHDCYSLVVDFYQQELGITLRHWVRDDRYGWWKEGHDLYMDRFALSGFVEVGGEEIAKVGDLILMQIESTVANHLAIYIGEGIMLHHLVNQLSRHDAYGGYWLKHTVKYLRYAPAIAGKSC